jgi:phosphatidylserine/phosphatidylglycerophosphate/cardiolipin synthase-like enzyme/uncharacterized membrane protein YdjX (TVP38/TMEM64 family)
MLLQEGKTVWRRANAKRAAILNDGAAYFGALRAALLRAQRSVFILGWDFHSQTRFVGPGGKADDGFPELLGDFLVAVTEARPGLDIRILIWSSSVVYASEREWFAARRFRSPERLNFCLDDCLPVGSAQHQKVVVIDDSIAFSGGLDLTIRRWDTSEHRVANEYRVDPDGVPYPPFHDVQIVVDGEAARVLGKLARYRWECADCDSDAPPPEPAGDPWPENVIPHFRDATVGVARTEPAYDGKPEVNEVERLFHSSIEAAEREIYLENQFLSSADIAQRLVRRMQERPQLELLMIAPARHASWLEARTMRNGRHDFMRVFADAGMEDRVRLLHPHVAAGENSADVMVHSKVAVIDDRILRVGSANLNNRSMGADSECDIVIEAGNDKQRQTVRMLRDELLGHHCGVDAETVRERLGGEGGLLKASGLAANGHSLKPVRDGDPDPEEITNVLNPIADPRRPLGLERAAARTFKPATIFKIAGVVTALLLLAAMWRLTPLREYLSVEFLRDTLRTLEGNPAAPVIVVAIFVVGGLLVFPVLLLIAATAAALGQWVGFGSAMAGVLASASVVFGIGRLLGERPLKEVMGPRLGRIHKLIIGHGVVSVALVRMVPVAPFSIVNVAAGASGIKFSDYLIGTVLGMAPGLVAMSAFGAQIAELMTEPTWRGGAILLVSAAAWLAFSFGVQFVVTWMMSRRRT